MSRADKLFPDPVRIINADAGGSFVLACEHAGNLIPDALKGLGLSGRDLQDHIAWDPGAAGLTERLAALLDAPAVLQRYSRLLCDCNREPGAPGSIVERADGREVPGNARLNPADRQIRFDSLYHPFHAALEELLDERPHAVLVTVHSFTPVMGGRRRDLHVGVIHEGKNPFAERLARILGAHENTVCRLNEPYAPEDGVTHTLARHGIARGLDHAMIEVRNDLLREEEGQALWAVRLARALRRAAGMD